MRLLKPGGRCGIVLPDGTLFGEGVKTRIKTERIATQLRDQLATYLQGALE